MQIAGSEEISEKLPYPGRSVRTAVPELRKKVIYPERDGKSMSDNTKQFNRIVKIKEGVEVLFADNPDVFVAGDLLWYSVEGSNKIRIEGGSGFVPSSREEGNIARQVVFEVMSPENLIKTLYHSFCSNLLMIVRLSIFISDIHSQLGSSIIMTDRAYALSFQS